MSFEKGASILEQANQHYCCLKLGVFATRWGLVVQFHQTPSGKSIHIRMVHCLSANGLGQPEAIQKDSQSAPFTYVWTWTGKKLTKKDNLWLLKVGLLQLKSLKYIPFFRLIRQNVFPILDQTGLKTIPYGYLRWIPTPPLPPPGSFSIVLLSVSDFFSKICCRVSTPSLTVTAISPLPGKQRK